MASNHLSLYPTFTSFPTPNAKNIIVSPFNFCSLRRGDEVGVTECNSNGSAKSTRPNGSEELEIGSPIIMVDSPQLLKTAASVPCLRANAGLVKPGDVGRIVARKPKDVWAIRLKIGTYLIDGKYFKPLEVDD